jgi:hypothetical protein
LKWSEDYNYLEDYDNDYRGDVNNYEDEDKSIKPKALLFEGGVKRKTMRKRKRSVGKKRKNMKKTRKIHYKNKKRSIKI